MKLTRENLVVRLLLALGATGLVAPSVCAVEVAFIVGNIGLPDRGDRLVFDLLEDRGYLVTLVDDGDSPGVTFDASEAADLTIISESVASGEVNVEVWDTTTPVITSEPFLYDEMAFELTGGQFLDRETDITIVEPSHPLAAGLLAGDVSIFDAASTIGFATDLGDDATVIATISDDPGAAALFVYEEGAILTDGDPAPAMRIGLPHAGLTLPPRPTWTDEGRLLFEAAIDYALGLTVMTGDFDRSGELDLADVNMLNEKIAAARDDDLFDLDGNGLLDEQDLHVWVDKLRRTWIGDVDLNGEFTSNDLVLVLQAGTYERNVEAGWDEGDWTGDLRFSSQDLVAALQDGGYESGPKTAVAAVPEPLSCVLLLSGVLGLASAFRHHESKYTHVCRGGRPDESHEH